MIPSSRKAAAIASTGAVKGSPVMGLKTTSSQRRNSPWLIVEAAIHSRRRASTAGGA